MRVTVDLESTHVVASMRTAGTRSVTSALVDLVNQCWSHSSQYPFGRSAPYSL
jgi:hypothetical protein